MLDEIGPALLFELRGENPAAVHFLSEEVFRIGSDAENNLILKDPGVALYQTEVNVLDRQYVIRNLSLEGTAFLNGETFEETLLQKGDILTLGDSMFRFVAPGEVLTQEELWQPVGGKQRVLRPRMGPFRRISFLLALSVLALGVVVFIMFTQSKKVERVTQEAVDGIAKVSSPGDRRELDSLYNRGVDFVFAKRWDEAIFIFDNVRKETPNYKTVESRYQQALMESRYQQALMESRILDKLTQGKGLFTEGQWVQAKAEIKDVPEQSFYYREAERLIREIDSKILAIRLRNAERFVALKDWEKARREAEAILALDPSHPKALRIQKEAMRMMGKSKRKWYRYSEDATFLPPKTETAAKETAGTGKKPVLSKPKPVRPPPRGTPAWNVYMALSAYNKGDTDTSLRYLGKVVNKATGRIRKKASTMTDDLRSAASYYHQAQTLQNEGRYAEALEMWEKFLEKDRNITSSKNSSFFRKASDSLGEIYYQRGEKAFHSGDLVRASRFWRMAKKIDPKDKEVKKGLVLLSEKAQVFYREGYSLQDINPERAVEKWKVVLEIVPPGHDYYKKAKRLVDRYAVIP